MARPGKAAAILAAALALDMGLAQVAKRVLPQWHATMPASNPRVASPIFHHGLRPMMDTRMRAGAAVYPFATNALGMVDDKPRRIEPSVAACRYLMIGDAAIEGYGVGWRQSVAGILARRWRVNGVDVLNAGVAGYSPTIHYRRIRHLVEDVGLRFGAVLVFVDASDIGEEWWTYDLDADGNVVAIGPARQMRPMRDPNWRDHLRFWAQDNSVAGKLVKIVHDRLTGRPPPPEPTRPPIPHRPSVPPPLGDVAVAPPEGPPPPVPPGFAGLLGSEAARWAVDPESFAAWGREGLRVAAGRMDRLAMLLRAHDIALTVAVHPSPDEILAGDRDAVQVRFWREWARTRGAGFLDLFPPFLAGDDPLATIRRYFAADGPYWNAAGHAVVAERVDQAVEPRRACR
jgi:hypothetical protein